MYLVTFHHSVLEAPLLHVSTLHFLSASSVKHEQRNGSFFVAVQQPVCFLTLKVSLPPHHIVTSHLLCLSSLDLIQMTPGCCKNHHTHTHTPPHRSDRSLWLGILLFERDTSGLQWLINLIYCCLLSNFCLITIFISVIIVLIDC